MEACVGERKTPVTSFLSLSIQLIPMWLPMIQSNTKVSHPLGCLEALFPPENLRVSVREHYCPLDYKEGTILAYSLVSWADNAGDFWQIRGLQRASAGALVLLTVDEGRSTDP